MLQCLLVATRGMFSFQCLEDKALFHRDLVLKLLVFNTEKAVEISAVVIIARSVLVLNGGQGTDSCERTETEQKKNSGAQKEQHQIN